MAKHQQKPVEQFDRGDVRQIDSLQRELDILTRSGTKFAKVSEGAEPNVVQKRWAIAERELAALRGKPEKHEGTAD